MVAYSETATCLWKRCFFFLRNDYMHKESNISGRNNSDPPKSGKTETRLTARTKGFPTFMVDLRTIWGYHGDLLVIIWATYGRSRVELGSI